jgi:hypothetical protein
MDRSRPSAGRSDAGYHGSLPWRALRGAVQALDSRFGWHRLPTVLGLVSLIGLRDALRRYNLHDTTSLPSVATPPLSPAGPEQLTARTLDGTYNDLEKPDMGRAGSRFGRNIPLDAVRAPSREDVLEPNPREVSRALMTRTELVAATSVNALVAPWLQWMIRDWFSHGQSPPDEPWEVALTDDDPWPGERPLHIMRTMDDETRPPTLAPMTPTYVNTSSHWWDASQIYGNTAEYQQAIRTREHGKLHVDSTGALPFPKRDGNPTEEPGFWVGLVMLQTLFTREHNAVCDMFRKAYPHWTDEETFQRARLVVAALIAKIHTVEWTPAVISHPTTVLGMRANWWGLAGERLGRVFGRLGDSEVLSGIPGSPTQHYGVPYSLTEEFAAVYRMHPLMPDDYRVRGHADDGVVGDFTLRDLSGPGGLAALARAPMRDWLYSFGTMHPGVVTLHNFPRFLQEFERPDGKLTDLAATDILRHRELAVPRYCEFRRHLRMRAPATFEELTEDPATAAEISRIYGGDIEKVDLMVGLFAEKLPKGFAFSDTAFRIFIVMASRRLNSDRFLTRDFTPEVYTREGLRWLADNSMTTVLLRHHPELRAALRGTTNAFHPWNRAGAAATAQA